MIRSARNFNRRAACFAATVTLALGLATQSAWSVTDLKHSDNAPPIDLVTLDGEQISNKTMLGKCTVLVFGELFHDKTLAACRTVHQVLSDRRFEEYDIQPVLIVAQRLDDSELKTQVLEKQVSLSLAHDPWRKAFGAYRVSVMPSTIVVDRQGLIVHAVAGDAPNYADIVSDAVSVAVGRLTMERFEQTLKPSPLPKISAEQTRADRLASLARQLKRRGMVELAMQKYEEALAIMPGHVEARLGQGKLHLEQRRLAEAESHFRAVLKAHPQMVEANLGAAYVQALRGGDELSEAERTVHDLLARNNSLPRAHYLMGFILEQRGQGEQAMQSYRKAAELLLERAERE